MKALSKKGISIRWSGTIGSGTPPRNRASPDPSFLSSPFLRRVSMFFPLVLYYCTVSLLPTFLIYSLYSSFVSVLARSVYILCFISFRG